jgi:hypothetical protein
MTTGTILMNADLAAGTTALVAIAMFVVPNTERLRELKRFVTRRPVRRGRERRFVAGALRTS